MTSRLDETLAHLAEARRHSSSILVAFSGGKDSRVTLDLCMRTFDRVEAFFMYFLPDLQVDAGRLTYATERGIKMHFTPHWVLYKALRARAYMPPSAKRKEISDVKLRDVYDLMIARTGIPMIASGARDADSLWRRRNLTVAGAYEDCIFPIRNWNKHDVVAYLMRRSAMPATGTGRSATGVDLSAHEICYLADHSPEDYAKLLRVFPYAGAVVMRRDLFQIPGSGESNKKRGQRKRSEAEAGP